MLQEESGLFQVRLNDRGRKFIRKFAATARIIIIAGIVVTLIYITAAVIRIVKIDPALYESNTLLYIQQRLWPFYIAVYSVLFFLQMLYLYRVSKYLRYGADYGDEQLFNESFRVLFHYAGMGASLAALALLMSLLDFGVMVTYLLN